MAASGILIVSIITRRKFIKKLEAIRELIEI
jgi:ribonuclease HIII